MASPNQPDPATQQEDDSTSKMSFFDHLEELRHRIVYSLIAIGLGLCVGLYYSNEAYAFLARPMIQALQEAGFGDKLIYTSPLGPIRLLLTVGMYLGIVLASPIVLYQVWLFVAPGLYRHERRAATSFMVSSVFLFFAGTAFGYVVMLPLSLKFLITVLQGPVTPMISINDYFDMVLVILLGLGVVFQLPILIFFLSLFGIVTPRFLWENFRYAVLIIAILAAIVTPTTDPLTMIIFMAPMIVLYLIGIGVAHVVAGRRDAATGKPASAGAYYVVLLLAGLGAGAAVLWWAGSRLGWWSFLR